MANCHICPLNKSMQCANRSTYLHCHYFTTTGSRYPIILATLENGHFEPFISSNESWQVLWKMSVKIQRQGTQSEVFTWSDTNQHYVPASQHGERTARQLLATDQTLQ